MINNPITGIVLGLALGVGIWLTLSGLTRHLPTPQRSHESWLDRWIRLTRRPPGRAGQNRDTWLVSVALLSLATTIITGMLVALILVPIVGVLVPLLLSNPAKRDIHRLDALETWVRSLRSLLQGGADNTLEGVLRSSVATAPAQIRPELMTLMARLEARWPADRALQALADDLADPVGDTIVAALILAVRRRGSGLSDVLAGLAESVADEVRARRKIESERSSARAAARYVTIFAATMGLGLAILNPSFLHPYTTGIGQLLLAAIVTAYIAALWVLRRITTPTPIPRIHPVAPTEGGSHVI